MAAIKQEAAATIKQEPKIELHDHARLKTFLKDKFAEMVKEYGGPLQFLDKEFIGADQRSRFATRLLQAIPRCVDKSYLIDEEAPADGMQSCIHICDVGFTEQCSVRPPHRNATYAWT